MNMKTIIKNMLLSSIMLAATSCTDFLDRQPLDEISNDSFWNTEEDMRVYNNRLYNMAADCGKTGIMIAHGLTRGYITSYLFLEQMSDNLAPTNSRTSFFVDIKRGKRTVPVKPENFDYQGWNFLREINFGLENYNRVPISDEIKNKYIAEARLFRGWFYAVKVQRYGDVQWVDKPLNIDSEELYETRNSRMEVMDKVLDDLNFATKYLPNDWKDGNAPGRLNRWCALLIKSRLCLFEGTYRKYHQLSDYERWIKEAKDAAYLVITESPYGVYKTSDPANEDYAWLHRQIDLTGNPEIMYWARYTYGINSNNVMRYFANYNGGATRSFVESFLCTDGLPISLSPLYRGDAQIEDVFKNRDPRLRQSILHPADKEMRGYDRDDVLPYPRLLGMVGGQISTTGYHVVKPYNMDIMRGKSVNQLENAGVILRYGEALLNYAEAVAEYANIEPIKQSDLDISINLLRDRVGMPRMVLDEIPVDPAAAEDGVSPLIYEIRRERRVELFCEGFRYDDLMRWKLGRKLVEPALGILWDEKAKQRYEGARLVKTSADPVTGKEYVDAYKGTQWENGKFDEERDYLWPIPISILTENPEVGQNPKWGE